MDTYEKIESEISIENLQNHLEWFSQIRRDTGGPGEDAACDYMVQKLKEYGVPVRVHEFDAYLSYPRRSTLEIIEPERLSIPCVTHSYAKSTGPEGVSGKLCSISDLGGVVEEQIILARGLANGQLALEGSQKGTKALIFANPGEVIHNLGISTIWGTPTMDQVDRLASIPVISISNQDGEKLMQLMAEGPVTVKITTEVETGWYRSKIPEAIIEGTEEPERFVLMGSHYCAWEVGVTDNATGNALLLEVARVLMQHQSSLKRSIRFCWWTGHTHGRYSGSTWYADNFFEELDEHCIAYHNVDSPGVRDAAVYVGRHTSAEWGDFCRAAIQRVTGQKEVIISPPQRNADQSFLGIGVPSFSMWSYLPEDHPDRRPWIGGCAGAWWWHHPGDTLDKADPERLARDTLLSAFALAAICTAPILPVNLLESVSFIAEFIEKLKKEIEGHLDYTRLSENMERLNGAAEQMMTLVKKVDKPEKQNLINITFMRFSRTVGPIIFSHGDRFRHEPATKSKKYLFPGLDTASRLGELVGKQEYGFLLTQIKREMNRLNITLKDAADMCENTARILTFELKRK